MLALRIAFGAATHGATLLLAALYGYGLFASQLDAWQHHYQVFPVLVLACFVPWKAQGRVAAWSERLILSRWPSDPEDAARSLEEALRVLAAIREG